MTSQKTSRAPDAELDQLMLDIKAVGARVAYDTLLSVCRDPKAAAPAKATAATGIVRMAGLFERGRAAAEKQPHEMTAEELADEIARLRRGQDDRRQDPDDGVFG